METGHPTQMGELPERFDSLHFALYTQRMIKTSGEILGDLYESTYVLCVQTTTSENNR